MPEQQFKFALVFIVLGALLGWFSHSAFNNFNSIESVDLVQSNPLNTNFPDTGTNSHQSKKSSGVTNISVHQNRINRFTQLLKNVQYHDALILYQENDTNNDNSLEPVLINEIERLTEESDNNVFQLLDVFLQEYYNNSTMLISQANALILSEDIEEAFDSYFLAKNYAQNNKQFIEVNQMIHKLSIQAFKQFQASNEWQRSIDLLNILIENEPQFAFYHLALAQAYLKLDEIDKALTHLQNISEDSQYGSQASELIVNITLAETAGGISLDKENNHYLVNASLSDVYKAKLMIDTGASYSSLSSYTIAKLVDEQLAKKIGSRQIYTAGGEVDVDLYQLNNLSIGPFSVNDIIVAELDLQTSSSSDNNFEGLLGINFLNEFDFSIDQDNKQLILSPKL